MDYQNGIPALASEDAVADTPTYTQELREYLLGSGWVTTGYTPDENAAVSSFEICRFGAIVQIRIVATLASLPNVNTFGDCTNTTVLTLPAEFRPEHIGSINSSGIGRAVDAVVLADGRVQVGAVSPDATQTGTVTLSNVQVSLGGTYMLG